MRPFDPDRRRFLARSAAVAAGWAVASTWPRIPSAPAANAKESTVRTVHSIEQAKPTLEGAGVHLHRAFGFGDTDRTDPFLLFDDFRNDEPWKFQKGFPWHPHRGIETITYVLAGTVDHADSLGNSGSLGAGDVQWMTAGSGILHQEMPHGDPKGRMHGFQLWANLPASKKMTAPRYQDVEARDIPTVTDDDGTAVRVVVGDFWGQRGPVEGIAANPRYLDVSLPPNTRRSLPVETTQHAFAYVFEGAARFRDASDPRDVRVEDPNDHGRPLAEYAGNRSLVLFDRGDEIVVEAGDEGARFLLVSGEPLREPVAWRGPIVMNTREELDQAWRELREGTFIRQE
jgi:hypothetical protein